MGNGIGEYNTCGHLCKYCYANANKGLVIENMKKHNEKSPFLIGGNEDGDRIMFFKIYYKEKTMNKKIEDYILKNYLKKAISYFIKKLNAR